MAARAAGTGRWRGWRSVPAPTCRARARRESAAAAVAALRRRSAGAAPAGTAAAGAGLCPRRFAGGRRTDPAGVRRIARRSLAGRVAGSTRRTGPGRIGGAAGGSPGCAAGAPGVDLRTVRRQRGGGAGGGLFDWLGALRDDAASLLAARRPLLAEPTAPLERLRQRVLGLPAEIRPACLDALRADAACGCTWTANSTAPKRAGRRASA